MTREPDRRPRRIQEIAEAAGVLPSADERRRLVETPVTLDGKAAVISGAVENFASVTALPDGPSYEWSWRAVAEIVAAGGDFRS